MDPILKKWYQSFFGEYSKDKNERTNEHAFVSCIIQNLSFFQKGEFHMAAGNKKGAKKKKTVKKKAVKKKRRISKRKKKRVGRKPGPAAKKKRRKYNL